MVRENGLVRLGRGILRFLYIAFELNYCVPPCDVWDNIDFKYMLGLFKFEVCVFIFFKLKFTLLVT